MAKTNVKVEVFYSGAWHDITASDDVYTRDPIRIAREPQRTPAEGIRVPSWANLTIENRDGRYSTRNPNSPLYGLIGRNTPLRISEAGRVYAAFTGTHHDRVTTPDNAALDITGDIDVRVDLAMDPWFVEGVPGVGLAAKYVVSGNQVSWGFYVTAGGGLAFRWSPTGAEGAVIDVASLIDAPLLNGKRIGLRATLDVNNGAGGNTVTFYTAPTIAGPWAQLGDAVVNVGTTSIFSGTAAVEVGNIDVLSVAESPGKVYAAEIRSGIGGTVVANPDFTAQTAGATSFVDAAGRTWTVQTAVTLSDVDIRLTGEVESWPKRWNVKGNDVWAPITAYGLMRRLTAPGTTRAAVSALHLAIVGITAATLPSAYYPLERGPDSAVVGGAPCVAVGDIRYGTGPVALGSGGGADFSYGGQLTAPTGLTGAPVADWEAEIVFGMDALPPTRSGANIRRVVSIKTPDSQIIDWGVVIAATDETTWYVGGYYSTALASTNLFSTLAVELVAGHTYHVRIAVEQDGADIAGVLYLDGVAHGSVGLAGITVTEPVTIVLNEPGGPPNPAANVTSVSHVGIWSPARPVTPDNTAAMNGNQGETAADRITRLCAEDGITIRIVGDGALTALMGPELTKPLLDKLIDAADVDGGILYEPRDFLGLAYRTHASLYNQPAVVELDYAAGGEVAPPLEPVEDTDHLGNDITVTRYQGASAQAVQESGPLNVHEPSDDPEGVGRYRKEITLLLNLDTQCPDQAGWRRHLGTWDEDHYPVIRMDLTAMRSEGKTTLAGAAADLDIGDQLTITSPPAWLPPEDIAQLAQGFVETLASHERDIAINATPAGPWAVGVYGAAPPNGAGPDHYESDGAQLAEDLTTVETGVDVATPSGPLWTTDADDFPFDVLVGGERMTVTTISGASSPQTFTVTRSVNGIVKTHLAGAPLRLFKQARYGR